MLIALARRGDIFRLVDFSVKARKDVLYCECPPWMVTTSRF